jgi:hypothetical protein
MACASSVPWRGFELAPYSERSLLFAKPDDLVYLHALPDPKYVAYLNELGIGPRKADVIACPDSPKTAEWPLVEKIAEDEFLWRELVETLRSADEVVLQPYMTTRFESEFVRRLRHSLPGTVQLIGGDSAVIEHFDQKHRARAVAAELGIPVAPGEVMEVAKSADWFGVASAIRRQLTHTGRVIVRGALGSNGSSVQVVSGSDEVTPCIERLQQTDANRLFLVEAMFEVTSSPNVGMFIHPRTRDVSCFSCTEQVLGKGLAHAGNRYPPIDSGQLPAMIAAAERFAVYLRDQGVTGHLGFDFCEYKSHAGGSFFLLAELNPRINGATYCQTLFAALNQIQQIQGGPSLGTFHALKMCTSLSSFASLENALGELLFRPGQQQGIVPVGLGALSEGKCGIVMVANQAEGLEELHPRVAATLQPAVKQRAA